MNLPNTLTAVRIALTPFVYWAVVSGSSIWALALFAIAALTDWLDGKLARYLNLESGFGAKFDPVADKVLMIGVFVALAETHSAPWLYVWVVLLCAASISVGAVMILKTTDVRDLPPSKLSKVSTLVQMLLAGTWMVQDVFQTYQFGLLIIALLWISTALTVVTWLDYLWKGVRLYIDDKMA